MLILAHAIYKGAAVPSEAFFDELLDRIENEHETFSAVDDSSDVEISLAELMSEADFPAYLSRRFDSIHIRE